MKNPLSMISRSFFKKNNHLIQEIPNILPDKSTNYPIFFECGPKKTPVIFLKNNHQQRVLLDPADYFITVHFMEHLDWEEHLDEIYKKSLRKGGHYIDIGANIGLHVLRAHRLGADSITAFEPNPNTFQVLKMNTELNGIKCDTVECALSNMIGSANFNTSDVSAGMAHISNDSSHQMTVKTRTLNSYFENKDTRKLSLVKIDVEGHEGEVIKGSIEYLKRQKNFVTIQPPS